MLTPTQVDHYRTFGFVVLPGLLAPERVDRLHVEVDTALRDAYAATYHERVIDGISGHYLPMASRHTPVSASLVCDDPTLIDAAEQLVGGPVIPECPEGVLYFAEAGWHNDDGIGVTGIKFATYFDSLHADNGALRFLPGSHIPEQTARLTAYRSRQAPNDNGAWGYPGNVAITQPGDVLAFDLHTWHASFGGHDRLAWTIIYTSVPHTQDERDRTLRSMTDSYEQSFRGFDRDRYPIWHDWLNDPSTQSRRTVIIERMRAAGILDLPAAQHGW